MIIASSVGVNRIELCAAMHLDGLTPAIEALSLARKYFLSGEIMVMIRPRAGNFSYSPDEILLMKQQIELVASAGANGVVFGALLTDSTLDINSVKVLSERAKSLSLKITFHRAFDAVSEPLIALQQLIALQFDHVLTAGISWGAEGGAEHGIGHIIQYVEQAGTALEIILAGGVSPDNARFLVDKIRTLPGRFSLHSYSGVMCQSKVDGNKVGQLKLA